MTELHCDLGMGRKAYISINAFRSFTWSHHMGLYGTYISAELKVPIDGRIFRVDVLQKDNRSFVRKLKALMEKKHTITTTETSYWKKNNWHIDADEVIKEIL